MKQMQAVLVVSFGTTHLDTLKKSIEAVEQAIRASFPGLPCRRAFTSRIIMKKLREQKGIDIDDVTQALTKLEQEGFTQVILQPTHMINGDEYGKLCRQAAPFAERLSLSIGAPLLTSIQDYKDTAAAIMDSIEPPADNEAIVFMGHGSANCANASYALLEYLFHDFGWDRAFIGTVEGYPELTQVMKLLQQHPEVKRVRLHPLMIVAGDHACNDMDGTQDDSWRAQLTARGYDVTSDLHGLGEYPRICALFAQHALSARTSL